MTDLINDIMSDLNKGGDVAFLIEDGSPSDVEIFVSTGSTLLNYAISNQRNGGIPIGKITELSGLEGTGKTLVAMQICANTQKMGGLPIYMDTEHAFNSDFAKRVGLDPEGDFIYLQPTSCEDVFDKIFQILHRLDTKKKSKKNNDGPKFVVIVWDSVASTPTKTDITDENSDPGSTVGLKPRILSKNIATLLGTTGRKNVGLVFVNQLRMIINAGPFQDKYITPGGKAIPYASSVRVRLLNAGKLKIGDNIVGIKAKADVNKTRFGPPYRKVDFPIYFTHGVDDEEGIVDILAKSGIISKRNAGRKGILYWVPGHFRDKELAVGKPDLKKELMVNEALRQYLEDELEKIMVIPMIDPRKAEFKVVDEDGKEINNEEVV